MTDKPLVILTDTPGKVLFVIDRVLTEAEKEAVVTAFDAGEDLGPLVDHLKARVLDD